MSGWRPSGFREDSDINNSTNFDDASAMDAWNPMQEDFETKGLSSFAKRSAMDIAKEMDEAKRSPTKSAERVIYVSYIPAGTTEEDLRSLFKACGEIVSLKVVVKDCFKDYIYCFITFSKPESAFLAVQKFHNLRVGGQRLVVELRSPTHKSKSQANLNVGKCAVCGKPGKFSCANCSVTFYCSGACLVDDDLNHTKQCGKPLGVGGTAKKRKSDAENSDNPIPSRMESTKVSSQMSSNMKDLNCRKLAQQETTKYPQALPTNFIQLEIGTVYSLVLMSVIKENEFYCVMNGTESENLLLDLNERLSNMKLEKAVGNIDQGALVVAPFEGGFYRAVVLKSVSSVEDSVKLLFIDYGNTESVPKTELMFTYDKDIIDLNYQAIKCSFADNRDFKAVFKGETEGFEMNAVVISQKSRTYIIEPEVKTTSVSSRSYMESFSQSRQHTDGEKNFGLMNGVANDRSMQNRYEKIATENDLERLSELGGAERKHLQVNRNQGNGGQQKLINPYASTVRSNDTCSRPALNSNKRVSERESLGLNTSGSEQPLKNRDPAINYSSSQFKLQGDMKDERNRDFDRSSAKSMERCLTYNNERAPVRESSGNAHLSYDERVSCASSISVQPTLQQPRSSSNVQHNFRTLHGNNSCEADNYSSNNSPYKPASNQNSLSSVYDSANFHKRRPLNFFYFPPYFPPGSNVVIQVVSDPIKGYFYAKLSDSFSLHLQGLVETALKGVEVRQNTEDWNDGDYCTFVGGADGRRRGVVMQRLVDNSIVLMDVDTGLKHICHPDNLYLPNASLCQISLNILHCKFHGDHSATAIKEFHRDSTLLTCQIVDIEGVTGIKYVMEIVTKNEEVLIDLMGSSGGVESPQYKSIPDSESPERTHESSTLAAVSSRSGSKQSNGAIFSAELKSGEDLNDCAKSLYRSIDIPVGTNFKALVCNFNSVGDFYVHLLNNDSVVRLRSICKNLEQVKFDGSLQAAPMHSGMGVLAKCSKQKSWERGVVVTDAGNVVTIFFIDYGIKEDVNRSYISSIPENLLTEAPVAVNVCVKGWESMLKAAETDLIDAYCLKKKNAMVHLTIVDYIEGKYSVKLD